VPRTYSTILTPRPPVSEDRGDKTLATSLPGKLPERLGPWPIEMGCETAWSVQTTKTSIKNYELAVINNLKQQLTDSRVAPRWVSPSLITDVKQATFSVFLLLFDSPQLLGRRCNLKTKDKRHYIILKIRWWAYLEYLSNTKEQFRMQECCWCWGLHGWQRIMKKPEITRLRHVLSQKNATLESFGCEIENEDSRESGRQ
jgi:hypothetical protein